MCDFRNRQVRLSDERFIFSMTISCQSSWSNEIYIFSLPVALRPTGGLDHGH